jgi:hypothetical protein
VNDAREANEPGPAFGPHDVLPVDEAVRRHFPHAALVPYGGRSLTAVLPAAFWVQMAARFGPVLLSLVKALTDRLPAHALASGASTLTAALPPAFWDAVKAALGQAVVSLIRTVTDAIAADLGGGATPPPAPTPPPAGT